MNDRERWILEWLRKGDNDLRAAGAILLLEDAPFDVVCFHTQQCVEKYLKGFLTFYQKEVRRTHDLVSLLGECNQIDSSFAEWEEVCEQLTSYAIEARYPAEFSEYSVEEAEDAVSSATRFKAFVRDKISITET
ncbi:HEPN domain-containing protein [Candidatus Poribacteria bacterium]|nr:HEPN domain-containing protein [Candidatus Poribacteria bacterium]